MDWVLFRWRPRIALIFRCLWKGCCIYVTSCSSQKLLLAKSRVAPLKVQTLARLELQAAYLGCRLLKFVCEEIRNEPKTIFAWTDSSTVWHWINKPAYHWVAWAANRVATIQQVNSKYGVKWRHCPGACNLVDLASRGSSGGVLCSSDWFDGPIWLKRRDSWPVMFCPKVNGEVLQIFHHPSLFVNTVLIACRWWERLSRWPRILGLGARLLQWKYGKTESFWFAGSKWSAKCYSIVLSKNPCFQI